MTKKQGFTLIELMIVVAIVGILAAIAVPSYQNYTRRAKVTELAHMVAPVKAAISEYYVVNEGWPTTASVGGWTDPSSAMISSTSYDSGSGRYDIVGTAETGPTTLRFTPTGSTAGVEWACTAPTGSEYAPASCR